MKRLAYVKSLVWVLPLALLCSCGSSKKAVRGTGTGEGENAFLGEVFVNKVMAHPLEAEYVTAKMKFNLRANEQNVSVGGSLRMKKDDVIQLSLVAFGFVEAGRIEFTKDDVLLVDRINKRYVRSPYDKVSFLKEAELDFYSLQALFRNELFLPGKKSPKNGLNAFSVTKTSEENAVISTQNKKLKFKFLTALATALIQQTQIVPVKNSGTTEFNWNYSNFAEFDGISFPQRHRMTLDLDGKTVELDILLSRLRHDTKWETRTSVKESYTEVESEVLLKKLLRL